MKTTVRFLLKIALGCLLFSVFSLIASSSSAKVTTPLFSEDFSAINSGGGFPPANWSTDGFGYWYGSSYGIDQGTGDGGYNGSAMFDMYNVCGSENLYSPVFDASAYNGAGATVTLDFDYWWERNFYDAYYGTNTVTIYANGPGGSTQITQLNSNADFTYDNSGSFGYYYDPLTDASLWKHLTLTIPAASLTSNMQIIFTPDGSGVCYGGGNFGIDNVVVTGSLPQNISFMPTSLDFGTVNVGLQSTQQCVTLTNPSSADVPLNQISITGIDLNDYQFSGVLPSVIPANGSANICLIFAPRGNGARPANLHITDNSDNDPTIDVPLTGIGSQPIIEIDPIGAKNTSTRMFKGTHTRLGDSLKQSLLVKNIGSGNLIVDPASYIGGDNPNMYVISRMPMPIPAGQSDTLSVTFAPVREGSDPAKLFILSNAGNIAAPIDLLGVGSIPKILLTPSIVHFDSVGIGTTVCQNIIISNPGSDTLILRRNYLSSNDGDFVLTGLNTEQSVIPPEQSKTVSICFTPIQQGSRVARFTVVTNIPRTFDTPRQDTGTISVDISGTGVPFGKLAIVSGKKTLDSSLVGVQVCDMLTVTNNGQADITITSAAISGAQASDFSLPGLTLPLHIPAQGSVNVNVCATPDIRGLRQAMLTVNATTNDKAISAMVPLAVFGEIACAAPNPLTLFDAVKVIKNNLDTQAVVVTNCGDIPAVYSATVTGDGYSILSPAGGVTGTVAPGGTVTYQVLFNPSSVGVKNGSLVISTANVANMNIPLSGVGACATLTEQAPTVPQTGVGASNTFDVTITNSGNFDWTPGNALITPSDAYTVLSVTPSTIPAGGTGDVKIQFSPKAIGLATAQLTFPNSGPCQDAAVVIDLSGQGIVNAVAPVVTADGFSLKQNYPNPFVNKTTFSYSIPKESVVAITLSDMSGKIVKTLVTGIVSEGDHSVTFDATQLSSGTYVYTLESGATRLSKVLVLSK